MKVSRRAIRCQQRAVPRIRFDNQQMTSFAGLVVFQQFFAKIRFKQHLTKCLRGLGIGKAFCPDKLIFQLVLHVLLGFRQLRDVDH